MAHRLKPIFSSFVPQDGLFVCVHYIASWITVKYYFTLKDSKINRTKTIGVKM